MFVDRRPKACDILPPLVETCDEVATRVSAVVLLRSSWAPAAEGASLALIHANIIDGTLDQVLRDATVLIRDGRIEAVGSASVPPGAEVLDLDGHCLLPGLIDAHAHLFNLAGARRVLEQGATTVRGALTQLPGSPFHTQAHSFAIGIDRSGRFAYEVVFELGAEVPSRTLIFVVSPSVPQAR